MTFGQAIQRCFSKYATFSGRAPRPEFWWFFLFTLVGNFALSALDAAVFGTAPDGQDVSILGAVFSLALLLPTLAVWVRRLHDTGRTGWWVLLVLIPVVGFLVLLWFFAQPGAEGPNRFGRPPEDPATSEGARQ